MQRSPGTYTQGTIYGQIGTSAIVGVGTSWMVDDGSGQLVSAVAQYDDLVLPGKRPIQILSIDDDQHITLGEPLPFGIPAGSAYVIVKRTVSPTTGTLGALQKLAQIGTSEAPRPYEAFDNGVSGFQLGFANDGRIELKVGAAGADGSVQNPWRSALLIDPATGAVSVTGLADGSGGGAGSTFNHILTVIGRPPDSFGADGDLAIDFVSGFVVYGPKAEGLWPDGIDMLAALGASLKRAAASAALAAAWAATPDNADLPGAPVGSRSAMHWSDQARAWAQQSEDVDIPYQPAGSRSAFNYAVKASKSAASSAASAQAAGDAAGNAVAAKANSGGNTDITSLGGLTTPLSVAQGGTGAKTAADARAALGAQAALGYAPFQPQEFQVSGTNFNVNGSNVDTAGLSVQFTAKGPGLFVAAQMLISGPGSPNNTEVYAGIRVTELSTGNVLPMGQFQGAYITTAATSGGQLNPIFISSGLTPGYVYRVELLLHSTGTISTKANNMQMGGLNL